MALGLAVNARGADHNRSGAYEADLSGEHDRLNGGPAHVAAAVGTEDRAAVMDSMILCKFLRGVFDDPFTEWAALLRAVTGWDVDAAELRATARRIVLAKRVFNLREGATAADDTLPRRLLETPLELGSGRTAALTDGPVAGHGRRLLRRPWLGRRGPSGAGRPRRAATRPCRAATTWPRPGKRLRFTRLAPVSWCDPGRPPRRIWPCRTRPVPRSRSAPPSCEPR